MSVKMLMLKGARVECDVRKLDNKKIRKDSERWNALVKELLEKKRVIF